MVEKVMTGKFIAKDVMQPDRPDYIYITSRRAGLSASAELLAKSHYSFCLRRPVGRKKSKLI